MSAPIRGWTFYVDGKPIDVMLRPPLKTPPTQPREPKAPRIGFRP